jgi:hypothetical protein
MATGNDPFTHEHMSHEQLVQMGFDEATISRIPGQ